MKYGEQFNPFGYFVGLFIPNNIAQSNLSDSSKLLLGRLFQYAGRDGKAFPSRKELSTELCWSLSKLDRSIKDLKEKNLIETWQQTEQSPSIYKFLYHKIYDDGGTVRFNSRGTVRSDKRKRVIKEEDIEDSKESKSISAKRKIKIKKIVKKKPVKSKKKFATHKSLRGYTYTKQDREIYRLLKTDYNTTDHDVTKTGYAHTMDMLHALFSARTKSPMLIKEEKAIWTHKDFLIVLNYYIKHHVDTKANGEKKKVNIGNFIFVDQKVNRHLKSSYSVMLNIFKDMEVPKEPETKIGKILFKHFNDPDTPMHSYDRIAKNIDKLRKTHESDCTMSITQLVIQSLEKEMNRIDFKFVYASGRSWFDDFVKNNIKYRFLKKKSKPLKDGCEYVQI